jgi:hypothetical protein
MNTKIISNINHTLHLAISFLVMPRLCFVKVTHLPTSGTKSGTSLRGHWQKRGGKWECSHPTESWLRYGHWGNHEMVNHQHIGTIFSYVFDFLNKPIVFFKPPPPPPLCVLLVLRMSPNHGKLQPLGETSRLLYL